MVMSRNSDLFLFFLLHRFINYLRMSYRSFAEVIRNSVHLARLIQLQEQCRANKEAEAAASKKSGVAVRAEIIPLRHDLTRGLWAEMQVCDVGWGGPLNV